MLLYLAIIMAFIMADTNDWRGGRWYKVRQTLESFILLLLTLEIIYKINCTRFFMTLLIVISFSLWIFNTGNPPSHID